MSTSFMKIPSCRPPPLLHLLTKMLPACRPPLLHPQHQPPTRQLRALLAVDFPAVTLEERQIRNFMQSIRVLTATGGQCRQVLEALLERQHKEDPDLAMQYLLDDQDRLKGVLWVSGEQRRDWIECGADVLIHDNTYNMDNLGYKLGVFSGISKEGLTFPVGTCFIVDEETCSYEWQFSTWLACQNGVAPTAVITDADPAVNCVVNTVFPEATHIWCRYHLMVNIFKNCRATVGGAIGRLINDWITVSKTQTRTAFTTR